MAFEIHAFAKNPDGHRFAYAVKPGQTGHYLLLTTFRVVCLRQATYKGSRPTFLGGVEPVRGQFIVKVVALCAFILCLGWGGGGGQSGPRFDGADLDVLGFHAL